MFWVKQCCKFWNKTIALPDGDIVKHALFESVHMALGPAKAESWAGRFLRNMCALGVISEPAQVMEQHADDMTPIKLRPIGLAAAYTAMRRPMTDTWVEMKTRGSPRDIPEDRSDGYKLATYSAWFAVDKFDVRKSFISHLCGRQDITRVARFRMGSHSLDIEARRWAQNRINRSNRVCTCCEMELMEDEQHVVVECPA